MTPCTVPSLASASTAAPAAPGTCGCAPAHPVEETAFAQLPFLEHDTVQDGYLVHEPIQFEIHLPESVPQTSPVGALSFVLLAWLIVGTIVARSQRRSVILRLGLAGDPAFFSTPRSRPRLVLSDRERRALRSISETLARFPLRPRPASAFAVAYSQPRFRNHMIMPPATTRQTPQKIG
jgi:hypothetical protein